MSVGSRSVKRGRRALFHIESLAQSIRESEENANDIVDLLQYLEVLNNNTTLLSMMYARYMGSTGSVF